ncbi:MAG: KamA family radical SAM protein [Magnetococcales bacterium]|nr:KamA family radical SAM protein [Magnetococcales bacterium]
MFDGSDERERFRRVFYPEADAARWSDWRWQVRHRLRDGHALARVLNLSETERVALARRAGGLPVAVTPYYASLMHPDDPRDPLRRTVIPVDDEDRLAPGERPDPLDERRDTVVPGVIQRHPDRVVILATGVCATYCRYCTRSRLVGGGERLTGHWEAAIAHVASDSRIRDVLISGGDPLMLSTRRLGELLTRLRAIPHVELLRIGSRMPLVLPMRITRKLVALLRRHQPLVVSIHATHPAELTAEAARGLARLADAGILLAGQTVLLAGINDAPETLRSLLRGLLRHRVRPYYLYQCDPIPGSAHFRVPVEEGIALVERVGRDLSGLAVPRYVIDAPGGGGKIPIGPVTMVGREPGHLVLRNAHGQIYRYPDPP